MTNKLPNAVVPAIPSATIVVLRDRGAEPELLMVKRRAGDAFGDSYAFPGGLVDDDESCASGFCTRNSAKEADQILQVPSAGLDFFTAAIRELFEETGILLAKTASGEWTDDGSSFEKLRHQVDQGKLRWSDFLQQQNLRMADNRLHYYAHWETPLDKPKRWTTRFFLAELPAGQAASHDGIETTDSRWLTASDALSLARDGTLKMPYPTIRNLQDLADFDSIGGLIDWAHERARSGIRKIRPILIKKNGVSKFTIFGDPDYPGEESE